jgi:ATP-dependent DNA helicase Q1
LKVTRATDRHESKTPTSSKERRPTTFQQRREVLSYDQLRCLDDLNFANAVIFGNESFRPLQYEACTAAMNNRDCFVLMPTGGGKSLCYQVTVLHFKHCLVSGLAKKLTLELLFFLQLPATLHPGVTVVVCPLLSLIQDQIVALTFKFGIPAAFLNSQQTPSQAAAILQELR